MVPKRTALQLLIVLVRVDRTVQDSWIGVDTSLEKLKESLVASYLKLLCNYHHPDD